MVALRSQSGERGVPVAARSRSSLAAWPGRSLSDSQSVPTGPTGGAVGYDAGKHVRGRKRHLVVDTEGFLVGVLP